MALTPSAAELVARLGLTPHPEGGHFRETFRDPGGDEAGRAHSTAIYFLLARGERSHWHRIDAVEVWHYYAGCALSLQIADDQGRRSVRLGPDFAAGEARGDITRIVDLAPTILRHLRLPADAMDGHALQRIA